MGYCPYCAVSPAIFARCYEWDFLSIWKVWFRFVCGVADFFVQDFSENNRQFLSAELCTFSILFWWAVNGKCFDVYRTHWIPCILWMYLKNIYDGKIVMTLCWLPAWKDEILNPMLRPGMEICCPLKENLLLLQKWNS